MFDHKMGYLQLGNHIYNLLFPRIKKDNVPDPDEDLTMLTMIVSFDMYA
jgi:hypothetical protein